MIRLLFVMIAAMSVSTAVAQRAQISTGTSEGRVGVRLAVPEFTATGNEARAQQLVTLFNKVLWDDLDYAGGITLASRSFYPAGRVALPADVIPEQWTRPGIEAEFLAFGAVVPSGTGQFAVEARLWDLQAPPASREASGERYRGDATPESVRLMAHRFADKIVQLIGGSRGIAQTKIAFVSSRDGGQTKEIWIMDYDGENAYALSNARSTSLTPSWSPDGDKVAFTSYQRTPPTISILSRLDRRPFRFEAGGGTTTTPGWSPDGSRIAFASSMEKTGSQNDMEIFTADWNGRNVRRLTFSRGVDISPTFNPRTGREIAFVSDRSGSPQIYVMDVEGGNVRRLIEEGGHAVTPAWAPDGQRIAFAWQRSRADFDIYIYDIPTGKLTQLTDNQGSNEKPTWAPDGRHLAFESTRSGRRSSQIYSMLADGTRVRQLTQTGRNQGPAWSGFLGQ